MILRDLPESVCTNEYSSLSHIVYDRESCVVHLCTHPSENKIEIVFTGVVGVKILDERDFQAFWCRNVELEGNQIEGALVSQVISGGWRQDNNIVTSYIPSGFYGEVMEFFVASDYECVHILCTKPPLFTVLPK